MESERFYRHCAVCNPGVRRRAMATRKGEPVRAPERVRVCSSDRGFTVLPVADERDGGFQDAAFGDQMPAKRGG